MNAASPRVARERLPLREPVDNAPAEFTRTALNEIDNRFTRLPNPDLVMYVFPHQAGKGGYPVPGYVTVFPMYEGIEYAMPGEVSSSLVTMLNATGSEPRTHSKAALLPEQSGEHRRATLFSSKTTAAPPVR
jgi:hypothetical protein